MSDSPQLDDISRIIGNLEAYSREFREGSLALTALINANEAASCERHSALKTEFMKHLERELDLVNAMVKGLEIRLSTFEVERHRRQGAVGVVTWLSKNWPTAGLLGIVTAVMVWANDKF